jgi:chromosome segregation protein
VNLTRVEDILRELNANLERLEKRAEVMLRYNAAGQRPEQHQLWLLKRQDAGPTRPVSSGRRQGAE